MSVTNSDGTKILLPRSGPDAFWDALDEQFAPRDDRVWKYLAMLALRENAGWPVERIARAFRHNKGHITRCLERIKNEIRWRFNVEDLWSDPVVPTPPPGLADLEIAGSGKSDVDDFDLEAFDPDREPSGRSHRRRNAPRNLDGRRLRRSSRRRRREPR